MRRDRAIQLRPTGERLTRKLAYQAMNAPDLETLLRAAARRRDAAHGAIISYSRKVFIPLTKLCRDSCHYCTFAQPPRAHVRAFLTREQVLAISRAGRAAGCREALFTLGDKPELRYRAARDELAELGHATTLSYLAEAARLAFRETGLAPHVNPGVMSAADLAALRPSAVSQGLMLESTSRRLCERGGPHFGSPDKNPEARLATIKSAGELAIPFTTGILIGIGETREERVDALFALRDLNDAYGHIQEIIIQNFRPKPGTRMAAADPISVDEHCRTIAVARLIFEPEMTIQAPPNLSADSLARLIAAGVNDWGGVSPVTPDYVNPEAPWPERDRLAAATAAAGYRLTERLAIYPRYARDPAKWLDEGLRTAIVRQVDGEGWPHLDEWRAGAPVQPPPADLALLKRGARRRATTKLGAILDKAQRGATLPLESVVALFAARGEDFRAVCGAADDLRASVNGDEISYVVTRNINYTNICSYKCQFCAFSKGKTQDALRGRPYDLSLDEIGRRAVEAWERGATEVCMQGGIHPSYSGDRYLDICRAVKRAAPQIHIHAFSPLEIHQGAKTLALPVAEFLARLKAAGLGTLPGTAAEILDEDVRAILCPDKITSGQWVSILGAAHRVGLRSTATIMFGSIETYAHWAQHLLIIRQLQRDTGGLTEFVPLPFVHMESPIYLKGRARQGPSFRESILMHAVARLALHPLVPNIQASWVKLGPEGAQACLKAGANDLGGTLMDESISRSAGASHGQEMTADAMDRLIGAIGRKPRQRTTLYAHAPKPGGGSRAPAREWSNAGALGPSQSAPGALPTNWS